MEVLPVIDLKGGLVVRGIAGRRDEYRPVESRLAAEPSLECIATAFAALGFRRCYLADLDAIEKGSVPFFEEKGTDPFLINVDWLVDAGLRDAEAARRLAEASPGGRPLAGIVAGLESLDSPQTLEAMLRAVGSQRLVFSLDMKAGRPLTTAPAWQGLSPLEIATIALRAGVRRIIVLDLARVGVGGGVGTEPLCRELRCLDAGLEIIAGGGVRSVNDLDSLARAGVSAALVASALHDGRLTAEQCLRR